EHGVAELDALVADVDAGAGDHLLHLVLRLGAEGAADLQIAHDGAHGEPPFVRADMTLDRQAHPVRTHFSRDGGITGTKEHGMAESREHTFTGTRGESVVREWPHESPRYVALLVHGYGEHIGRYEHVAGTL